MREVRACFWLGFLDEEAPARRAAAADIVVCAGNGRPIFALYSCTALPSHLHPPAASRRNIATSAYVTQSGKTAEGPLWPRISPHPRPAQCAAAEPSRIMRSARSMSSMNTQPNIIFIAAFVVGEVPPHPRLVIITKRAANRQRTLLIEDTCTCHVSSK